MVCIRNVTPSLYSLVTVRWRHLRALHSHKARFISMNYIPRAILIYYSPHFIWMVTLKDLPQTKKLEPYHAALGLKCYQVFRITLIIVKYNKDGWVSFAINHRLVQNLRSGRVLWRRHNHTRVALTILPNQDPGKIHVVTPPTARCIFSWVRSVSGKVHTASICRSWIRNKQTTCKGGYKVNLVFGGWYLWNCNGTVSHKININKHLVAKATLTLFTRAFPNRKKASVGDVSPDSISCLLRHLPIGNSPDTLTGVLLPITARNARSIRANRLTKGPVIIYRLGE